MTGLATLAVLVGAGCGSGTPKVEPSTSTTAARAPRATTTTTGASGTTTTTIGTTTTTAGPSSTTTTAGGATPESTADDLPVGKSIVLLKSAGKPQTVDGQPVVPLTFDLVQFLTGQAAIDAAVAHHEAGTCNGKPCVDDDYFVVNDNPKLRTLLVVAGAPVTMDGCDGGCPTQVKATLAQVLARHGYFELTAVGTGTNQRISAIHQIFVP